MKKRYKILIFVSLFYIIVGQKIYAVQNNNVATMSKEEIMEKYYELKKDNQELIDKYNELNGEWSEKKESAFRFITIGSSLLLLYSMGITIYVRKHIKDKIEDLSKNKIDSIIIKEIDERISKQCKKDMGHIENMIKDCKIEEKLMKEKNILVISENDEKEKLAKELLKCFRMIKTTRLSDTIYELDKYDVIVFNEINGNGKENSLNKIITENENEKAVYFYFNTNGGRFTSSQPARTNFANTVSTFYGNLLDLIKYQHYILLDEKKQLDSINAL